MTYDVIVLGVGGVGSAAVLELARRGQSVLGIDQFGPPHDLGSSHGETRIIRQAYFEHPNYVPLAQASYTWWDQLEENSPAVAPLYVQTGLLQVGPAGGHVLRGVRESAAVHGLDIEDVTPKEINRRWPGRYTVPDGLEGVYEKNSGYLRVEACVDAQIEEARRRGAQFRFDTCVADWQASEDEVVVRTETETFRAKKLVIAAGAWSAEVLKNLPAGADTASADSQADRSESIRFAVRRKPQFWFSCKDDRYKADHDTPAVLFELPHGVFYAFPQIGDAIKVAEHSGGDVVADPTSLDREVHDEDLNRVRDFCSMHMPGVGEQFLRQAVCMYTMSADEHFIVDVHPQHSNVAFAAGLSGHGFKFVGVLGQALADLVLVGRSNLPIGFLSCARESLRGDAD